MSRLRSSAFVTHGRACTITRNHFVRAHSLWLASVCVCVCVHSECIVPVASMAGVDALIEHIDACDDLIAVAPTDSNIEPLVTSLQLSIKRCKFDCKGTALAVERVRDSLFPEDVGKQTETYSRCANVRTVWMCLSTIDDCRTIHTCRHDRHEWMARARTTIS